MTRCFERRKRGDRDPLRSAQSTWPKMKPGVGA
jgi:hypothetical protein